MKKLLLAFFFLSFINAVNVLQFIHRNYVDIGDTFAKEKINNPGVSNEFETDSNPLTPSNSAFANAVISLPENIAPVGGEVVVPLNFQNLADAGAVSIKIQFDPSVITYSSITGQPSHGNFVSNASGNVLTVGWYDTTPIGSDNINFVNIHFTYIGGGCALTFLTSQCEIAKTNGAVISPIQFIDGSVAGSSVDTTPEVSLVENVSPVGVNVTVPLNFKNLANAASVSIKIQFNTSSVAFAGVSNQPSAGNFVSNAGGGIITIGWYNIAPLGIDSGKFVDLRFTYLNGTSDLSFLTNQCEIANPQGAAISPIVYKDGSVAANIPPHFTNVMPDTVINQNQELKFQFTATDPNPGTILKYTLAKKPSGAAIDSMTGEFSWTPAYNQSGDFEVSVIVSDGGLSDTSVTSVISVLVVNQPPQFNSVLSDTTIHQMQTLTFQYEASDPNGAKKARINSTTLVFHAVSVPEGASLDSLTGIFIWTPTYKQLGNFNIIVSVSDGELSAVDTAIINVLKTNVAPHFTDIPIGDTLHANRTYSFKLKADDPNGDAVTFSLGANPPSGASITSDEFKWIISLDQVGTHNIAFRVSDGSLYKDTTITLHIGTAVGVGKESESTPNTYGLKQNYPNPFNPSTTIRFQIPVGGFVSLKVFNVLGKEVSALVNESKAAGEYSVKFDANNLQSGLYLYQLKSGSYSEVRKMLLIK